MGRFIEKDIKYMHSSLYLRQLRKKGEDSTKESGKQEKETRLARKEEKREEEEKEEEEEEEKEEKAEEKEMTITQIFLELGTARNQGLR